MGLALSLCQPILNIHRLTTETPNTNHPHSPLPSVSRPPVIILWYFFPPLPFFPRLHSSGRKTPGSSGLPLFCWLTAVRAGARVEVGEGWERRPCDALTLQAFQRSAVLWSGASSQTLLPCQDSPHLRSELKGPGDNRQGLPSRGLSPSVCSTEQ